ncbi:DEAD/DEAH box helicase [Paenibacillus lutrae]|uniref:ATP-dependent helicase n=1 Tax=Paenibacillus lutrae TaxID=2078573 RepID=A0A7X3K1Q4_9BACL|nr:DEAD/DEAH box helicase [Paenibacillus lutrae]MVP02544.1 ATP-dependent helicase [Paenibacillus lutrae]
MIETSPLTVHAVWMPSGSFFVWGTRENGGIWDAHDLKGLLFAWHAPSFYGTFIESIDWGHREGLAIPALTALDFFGKPQTVQHLAIRWDAETSALRRLAPSIREALSEGRFVPDYEQWKAGNLSWKLQLEGEAAASVTSQSELWLDQLIPAWVEADGSRKAALRRLEEAHPLLRLGSRPADTWLDEEDWLVAIGWKHDPTPFRCSLQLLEPEGDSSWSLQVLLQDRADDTVLRAVTPAGGLQSGEQPLPESWTPDLGRVQRDIGRWLRLLPWLNAADGGGPARLRTQLSEEEAWRFLTEGSVRLVEAGYAVMLPAWWERARKLRPKLQAKLKSSLGGGGESMFGLGQLMQFDWRVAIDDLELSEEEFLQLLEEKRKLIRIRGRWVQLDPQFLRQAEELLARSNRQQGLTLREVLELQLLSGTADEGVAEAADGDADPDESRPPSVEIELTGQLRRLFQQLTRTAELPRIEPPASFKGTLRPYQLEGSTWLLFLRQFGLGACLADDMGLGKTIQYITYLLQVKASENPGQPSLLICPTSVIGNWQMELRRFAPNLRVHVHYGPQRAKGSFFEESLQKADLVITSYTLSHLDEEEIREITWSSICLDEAQNVKNPYTKQAAAIRSFQAQHRIALTGTPMENRLTELWSIFDFLNPGYLGTLAQFTRRFVTPIEKTRDSGLISGVQRLVRPFLMRRIKKDPAIQLDLPEKNESKTFVTLTAEQGTLYEHYIQELFQKVDAMSPMERRGHILAALTKLKQICNHPALILREGSRANWQNRSGKVERLLDMIQELRQQGDKCLIFTQFVETGHLLQEILQNELGEPVSFLHGGTPRQTRDAMIARFQNADGEIAPEEQFSVFILSLKAGGTGLNLTAANHVFHFDRWWNPAVENQATDRAFRIGQTRDVQVHKFVSLGTLEERIDEMIERKLGLSEQIVGSGENWITELSTDELKDMLSLRMEWMNG